jgi:hypothetical protein
MHTNAMHGAAILRMNYVVCAVLPITSSAERHFAIVNHNQQILRLKAAYKDAGGGQVSRLETVQPYM